MTPAPHDDSGFAWPPPADELDALDLLEIEQGGHGRREAATRGRAALVARRATVRPRRTRQMLTAHQLVLLAAGMLIGAVLPGADDGRRPVLGFVRAGVSTPVTTVSAKGTDHSDPSARGADDARGAASEPDGSASADATEPVANALALAGGAPVAGDGSGAAAGGRPDPDARDGITRFRTTARSGAAIPRREPAPGEAQVLRAVGGYARAWTRMDAAAVGAVWPSADRDVLARRFTGMREQRLTLSGCDVAVSGARATALCPGTLRYRPRVGDHSTRVQRGRWDFRLERVRDRWVIDDVETR